MESHPEQFSDFLLHYGYASINSMLSANTSEVHQTPYVLLAHIIEIVSANAFGLVVDVEDHTGTVTLALRGDAAFYFYEEHIRRPNHPDPITDPYALNDTWFGTYLFKIDSATQTSIGSTDAFIVPKLCMDREIVDRFFHYQMNEYECLCYRRSMAHAVLCGVRNGQNGVQVTPHGSRILRLGMGTQKRVYAPQLS